METRERTLGIALVVTSLMALVGLLVLFLTGSDTLRQVQTYSWPDVPGVVVGTTAKPGIIFQDKPCFYGKVVYAYTVNGQNYTCDLTNFYRGRAWDHREPALAESFMPPCGT